MNKWDCDIQHIKDVYTDAYESVKAESVLKRFYETLYTVLEIENIERKESYSLNDDFLEIGINSITGTRLLFELEKEFSVSVHADDITSLTAKTINDYYDLIMKNTVGFNRG